jgi:serine/threonine-protein kinase
MGLLTAEGAVIGTLDYMSPEQLQSREVDERSDLFAVGVMLVEVLTGHRPFRGTNYAERLTSILHEPYRPGAEPRLTRALDDVLQRCLAKDRNERFDDATELRSELIPALRGCPPLPPFPDDEPGSTMATGLSD